MITARSSSLARAPLLLLLLLALTACKDEDTRLPFLNAIPPAGVVTGPVQVGFVLQDKGTGRLTTVEVAFSRDAGQTFETATARAGSPRSPLQVLPDPTGTPGTFSWDPIADLGPGIHREVVMRFSAGRGVGSDTGVFTVDLSDRLDPVDGGGDERARPVAAPLPDDRVWVAGGERAGAFVVGGLLYDPRTNELSPAPGLAVARGTPGWVLLQGGQVLVAGGHDGGGAPSAAAETFQLTTSGGGQVTAASDLLTARDAPAVAALADGRAVVVGGAGAAGVPVAAVEVFTPSPGGGGTFAAAFSDPSLARIGATATTLRDGRVLVTGGVDGGGNPITVAALIDATATSVVATDSDQARAEHGAVLLPDGRVLVAGGTIFAGDPSGAIAAASIYDPALEQFTSVDALSQPRHRPGLAYAGGFAVAFGGSGGTSSQESAERYDVDADRWVTIAAPSGTPRADAVAVASGPGRALVLGGEELPEVYTPDAALSLQPFDPLVQSVPDPRADHTATRLADGTVLVVGGTDRLTVGLDTVERFDFLTRRFDRRASLDRGRSDHAAADTGAGLLVVGGRDGAGLVDEAELYDLATNRWTSAGTLVTPRAGATAVLLADGSVLVSGGVDAAGVPLDDQERWDPTTRSFSAAPALPDPRTDHRALGHAGHAVIGPGRGALAPTDAVDVVLAGSLNVQTATGDERAAAALALPPFAGGVVLVSGGEDAAGPRADAALLDARTIGAVAPRFLSVTRPLVHSRADHESVALANGVQVLLVGGRGQGGAVRDEGEVYGFVNLPIEAGSSTATGDRRAVKARVRHTATLLPNGRVLIVGGVDERGVVIAGAELFLP
jgi:hypothetical protein